MRKLLCDHGVLALLRAGKVVDARDRHVPELRAARNEILQRGGIHAELAAGGQARQHAHVLSLRGRGGADELEVQRALGREQVCAQRDGARDIVRALVHAGIEDALGRDAELFADRQLAR